MLRGENLQDRQKKDQVHRGGEKIVRQQEVIDGEETGVRRGGDGGRARGQVQTHQAGEHQRPQQNPAAGENDSRHVQVGRPGHRQVAAGHQAEQRELEEAFYRQRTGAEGTPPGAGVGTHHDFILASAAMTLGAGGA